LYSIYFDYKKHYGVYPDISYFISYPDLEIQQGIVPLLQTNDETSINWMNKHNIYVPSRDDSYVKDVESSILYFELKKIKQVQLEVVNRLSTEDDIVRLAALQRKYLELKEAENDIVKKNSTAIFKQIKN
jgi:DNA primase